MAPEIGVQAPDFTLKNTEGQAVSLSSFRGVKNVVLVFFTAAFSGVCTTQFTELAASESRFADDDAQVIGISVDSHHSLARFAEDLGLTQTMLLADFEPKGAVARDYGVYIDGYGVAGRASFVIDREGVIRGRSLTDTPLSLPDQEEYFRSLSACNR
jgi:mycoredoxin-dependent peroxiredoxin